MDYQYLYNLGNLLDFEGKYDESDIVFDSMMRLAAPDGRGRTQGRPRPRDINPRLTREQLRARLNPQAPVTPQVTTPTYNPDEVPAPRFRKTNTNYSPQQNQNLSRTLYGLDNPQTPSKPAPQQPATPVNTQQQARSPRKFYNVRDPKTGRFMKVPVPYDPVLPNNSNILDLNSNVRQQVRTEPLIGPQKYLEGFRPLGDQVPDTQTKPTPKTAPKNVPKLNMDPYTLKRKYYWDVWRGAIKNPDLRRALVLEAEMGRFFPETGDFIEGSFNPKPIKEFVPGKSPAGKVPGSSKVPGSGGRSVGVGAGSMEGGFSSANFAKILNSNKAGQALLKEIVRTQNMVNGVVSKIPAPVLKVISKVKFVFILLNFAKFLSSLINGTLGYKQTVEFIAACAGLNAQVLALLGQIPIVGPGLVIAVGAVNIGALDVMEFLGDPESGFNYMGIQITGQSMKRKTDQIDFRSVDISKLDPAVQNALKESIPLIQSGRKIVDILQDPGMVQKHPWLSKRDDIRFTQFSGALGTGGFYKQYKQQAAGQEQSVNQSPNTLGRQQNNNQPQQSQQSGQAQQSQQSQQLKNHNDLLYKAYVDTVQTTDITLENLKNYRDQIITKINNLAPMYPNINAQLAITALDNRIRKYSAQAKPA